MRPGVLGLRNLGLPCSGAISPGSNARRTSCGTVCRLWDQGMRNGTGALLVSADTSTGACARSCKRGSSLHSDPSRWETGQVKLLRRPRTVISASTGIISSSSLFVQRNGAEAQVQKQGNSRSSRPCVNAESTLWRDERGDAELARSPHHIMVLTRECLKRTDKC